MSSIKTLLFAMLTLGVAQIACAVTLVERMERVKAVADDVCSVTNVVFCREKSDDKVNALSMWAMPSEEVVKSGTGFVRIDFVLRPESGSDIRCRAEFPMPEKWDGRLWGQGNSGHAGVLPYITKLVNAGTAAVTTDLGTWSITDCGKTNGKIWPEQIKRDFGWRATHLMTVYGKKLAEAFLGKAPGKAYFDGGSTGGRQGLSEAIRYPEDYDGIIAHLPDLNAVVTEVAMFHLYRMTHDENGRLLFTDSQMRTVANAAVEYARRFDPKPYNGWIVADARWSGKDVAGFVALAGKMDPALADPELQRRLVAIHSKAIADGKVAFCGFAPGSYLGKNMTWGGVVFTRNLLKAKGFSGENYASATWADFDEVVHRDGGTFNATSADLGRFFARGGKLLLTTGWEDQTVPPSPIVEYYERLAEKSGGLDALKERCVLYCIPGCAHGGGNGRAMTCPPGGPPLWQKMIAWREAGVAPGCLDTSAKAKKMPRVAAYPGLLVQDAAGTWSETQMPRTKPEIDPFYLCCDIGVE